MKVLVGILVVYILWHSMCCVLNQPPTGEQLQAMLDDENTLPVALILRRTLGCILLADAIAIVFFWLTGR